MAASLAAGLELMLIGMGTVFAFLTLLVGATSLMSAMVGGPAEETGATATAASGDPTAEELAVIGAAVARHRLASRPLSSE